MRKLWSTALIVVVTPVAALWLMLLAAFMAVGGAGKLIADVWRHG
jgi:hypothetical protein